jgi:hypothetical protein
MLIFLGVVAIVFGVPLLILNQLTYGSPFIYGYDLFNNAYYPNRAGAGASGIIGLINYGGLVLLPGGFDLVALLRNLWRYLFELTPVLLAFGATGYILLILKRPRHLRTLLLLSALAGYVLIYTGSAPVWGTNAATPLLSHTMARYWIVVYLVLALLIAYLMTESQSVALKVVICLAAFAVGARGLLYGPDSLPALATSINAGQAKVQTQLLPATEDNAVIYAGRSDKLIATHRQVAAWYNSATESFFDAPQVARSMASVHRVGVPAYLVQDPDVDLVALTQSLSQYGLGLEQVLPNYLYRVVPLQQPVLSQ